MKMYDGMTFINKIGPFKMCNLHLEMYVNNDYECACGESHIFNYDSEILCQGAFKLILELLRGVLLLFGKSVRL